MAVALDGTAFAEVIATRSHVLADNLDTAARWPAPVPCGPALLVPLAMTGTVQGVLVVGLPAGSVGFDGDTDINLITTFAAQAALSVQRADAQAERELLVVLADRERIARDLHDVVIQRLFATGLGLQALTRRTTRDDVRVRLDLAIDDLDATILDIRTAIFALHKPAAESVRTALAIAIDDAATSLGFRPRLTITGPIDLAVTDALRSDLLAVVGESLSNVVKHAHATVVGVNVTVGSGQVTLRISDDGVGIGAPDGNGMVNLRGRAEDRGGRFSVAVAVPHGTILTWTVPLDG